MYECGTQNSFGTAGLFSCLVSAGGVRAPGFAGGLATCAELSVPLQEVRLRTLEEVARNPVDLGIPAEMCKLVVYTDGGAALRPCEGAVASWVFVVVFMCGNEAPRVIGGASGRVELDIPHSEHFYGTRLTNNVGELQAMCCAVLWLAEQLRIDDSMRVEIRFDSKYAAVAALGTQRCSSNAELVHKLRHPWHCVNRGAVGGVGMTHVRRHKVEPWNEMADSLVEAAMNGCSVPSSRTEPERWVMSFREVSGWSRLDMCCDATEV